MGIYTNGALSMGATTDYTSVEPFKGEHFNYHELGILAANEMAINHNALMQAIGLQELAAFEQTGDTDVFYEAVNVSGIIEKVKTFFKKIIEKIHKIFHTFVAKMGSWFGNNANFVKKYEKEVVKGWGNVKNDWGYKGYKFDLEKIGKDKEASEVQFKVVIDGINNIVQKAIADKDLAKFNKAAGVESDAIKSVRDKMDDIKDALRKKAIETGLIFEVNVSSTGGYDQSEYTQELFKLFRGNEDSKEELTKDDVTKMYGGLTNMMGFVKDFDKIKTKLETSERKLTKAIDKLIADVDKAQNEKIKENNDSKTDDKTKTANELLVQGASLIQNLYGAVGEINTQYFSAKLQATKDACAQAKEIMVKVVGQSKKITEESADVTSEYGDFLASVELV